MLFQFASDGHTRFLPSWHPCPECGELTDNHESVASKIFSLLCNNCVEFCRHKDTELVILSDVPHRPWMTGEYCLDCGKKLGQD